LRGITIDWFLLALLLMNMFRGTIENRL
jgi:hypothetical protein